MRRKNDRRVFVSEFGREGAAQNTKCVSFPTENIKTPIAHLGEN
jgi:hypothetical protein